MFEMAIVLVACLILMIVSYELTTTLNKREWGENSRSFF
jgi:hypothetical protein